MALSALYSALPMAVMIWMATKKWTVRMVAVQSTVWSLDERAETAVQIHNTPAGTKRRRWEVEAAGCSIAQHWLLVPRSAVQAAGMRLKGVGQRSCWSRT